ncbi:MAG: DUF2190 family protein [Ignavibacteriae bacterium]|nr:DUF2190 family protein [Ignavibacteriota bacterium]
MKEFPKILIVGKVPTDPSDKDEPKNLVYAELENQIVQGFQELQNVYYNRNKYIERYYFGYIDLEEALIYALNNKFSIVVLPYNYFNSADLLMIRHYFPSVNLIFGSCNSLTNSHCNILPKLQIVQFVSTGTFPHENNSYGYNCDFWLPDTMSPRVFDGNEYAQSSPGRIAGYIAYLMYEYNLSFWDARVLLICSTYPNSYNSLNENTFSNHWTELNGFGQPSLYSATWVYDNNHFFYARNPYLLYKLRTKDMQTEQSTLITSVLMPADRTKNLFIGLDGALCGNGAKALGVLNADTQANDYGPVMTSGIALVVSGAAVTLGAKVQSNANGQAIVFASGEFNGFALDAATGANQLIRVLLK